MDFSPLVNYIESFIRTEKGVPSCDIEIRRSHELLFRYRTGHADAAGTVPLTGNELYHLYSCSKPMTCAAALQLVEAGTIGLDDAVSRWLPEFGELFLLKEGAAVPAEKVLTVRHLFTMTGGFDYDIKAQPIREVLDANPKASTRDIISALPRSPIHFEPGARFQYSLCHDILGALVEAVSGERFSDYLRRHIWQPLGMQETSFVLSEADRSRLCAQYSHSKKDGLTHIPGENILFLSPEFESGGGGIISSVSDYARFADAMACGGVGKTGARILKAETIDLMRTEQLSGFAMNPAFGCAAGPGYGYGLGVRTLIDRSGGQKSSLGEFGWDGAAGSYIMMDPEKELSIFFAMHVLGWPGLVGCVHAPLRDLTYEILGL
ncbi:MAG: beta-lactamase family protein [Clostridia bacterium]|nr:beta-lactamase family protein [Clostridia bacterium]